MTLEISRRLIGGRWRTGSRSEGGGGGDLPPGGTTGQVLQKASNADGDVDWGSSGGSMPDSEGVQVGSLLQIIGDATITQPTFDQVQNPVLIEEWSAEHDYAVDLNTTDGVQFLVPVGMTDVFVAEVSPGNITGSSEPDWSASPNVGDTVSDGDVTWYNAGPAASFPPAPTTWAALTEYTVPAFVWPTVPNGHLYVAFPGYPSGLDPMTSGASEPDFPTGYGNVGDGDGFWFDAGKAGKVAWDTGLTAPKTISIEGGTPSSSSALSLVQGDEDPRMLQLKNETYDDRYVAFLRVLDTGEVIWDGDTPWKYLVTGGFRFHVIDSDHAVLEIRPLGDNNNASVILTVATKLPADGDLAANECSFAFDPTNGAAKFLLKGKTANGTVVTANVPMSP